MASGGARRPAPHGEDGGQKKTGKVPLSSHHAGGHGHKEGDYPTPPPIQVKFFHHYADTDADPTALHHTLGSGDTQASPGSHKHDGGSSPFLIDHITIGGTRGTSAYYQALEAALAAIGANITATG